jgi:hypothetical protein
MTRLDDLPPEILRRICEYALPQGMTFSFEDRVTNSNSGHRLVWVVWAAVPPHDPVVVRCRIWIPPAYHRRGSKKCTVCTLTKRTCENHNLNRDMHLGLFRVNKSISSEALGK